MITVNTFFVHWVKEISITKYRSDKELPPTFTPWEIYQNSDSMLKHLPKESLKTIQKHLLYTKEPVYYANMAYNRRNFNSLDLVTTGKTAAQIKEMKKMRSKKC